MAAKLFVAVLFMLFTLSVARSPLSKPENDVTVSESDAIEAETKTVVAEVMPLNLVRFRPINRRFRLLSRGCRHNGQNQRLPIRSGVQIPFGNDMILSAPNNLGDVTLHGGVRHVPPEWIPFLHRHGHYRRRGDGEEKLAKYVSKRYHRFDREKMEKNDGFGRRIRKFLKQYL